MDTHSPLIVMNLLPSKCATGLGPKTFKLTPTFPTPTLRWVATNEEAVEENTP